MRRVVSRNNKEIPYYWKSIQFSHKNGTFFISTAFGKLKIGIEHPCGGFQKSDAGFFEILIFWAEMVVGSPNLGYFLKICENFQIIPHHFLKPHKDALYQFLASQKL